jgi:hypothetical protein
MVSDFVPDVSAPDGVAAILIRDLPGKAVFYESPS